MNGNYAKNYTDLNHPSSVSGAGAFSEYILPQDMEGWEGLGQGSSNYPDARWQNRWLGQVIDETLSWQPGCNVYRQRKHATLSLDEIGGPHIERN